MRNFDPKIVGFTHHPNGCHVIRTKHGGWRRRQSHQLSQSFHAAFHRVIAYNYHLRRNRQSDFTHRVAKRFFSGICRFQMRGSGHEGNASVTKRRQVLDCLPDSVLVVNSDIADLRGVRADVDKYERNLAQPKIIEQ
jgi:hypothetical protein